MNQFEQSPSFEHPKFLHQCCDVCKCLQCETLPTVAKCINTFEDLCNLPSIFAALHITQEKQQKIQVLVELGKNYVRILTAPLHTCYTVGSEVCTGLTDGAIDYNVNNFHNISTEELLLQLGIASRVYCHSSYY